MSSPAQVLAGQRKIAIALAFSGALFTPLPLTWLHKFYLKQYLWGIIYLVLAPTLLPRVACCLEGIWYLTQSDDGFQARFPNAGLPAALSNTSTEPTATATKANTNTKASTSATSTQIVSQVATALRELEQLRQEGLITEYEFEQKRRKLIERM